MGKPPTPQKGADLSNAEKMISEDGKSPHTAHTVRRYARDGKLTVDCSCPIYHDRNWKGQVLVQN